VWPAAQVWLVVIRPAAQWLATQADIAFHLYTASHIKYLSVIAADGVAQQAYAYWRELHVLVSTQQAHVGYCMPSS
jgi:hypothetical protein